MSEHPRTTFVGHPTTQRQRPQIGVLVHAEEADIPVLLKAADLARDEQADLAIFVATPGARGMTGPLRRLHHEEAADRAALAFVWRMADLACPDLPLTVRLLTPRAVDQATRLACDLGCGTLVLPAGPVPRRRRRKRADRAGVALLSVPR